MRRDRLAVGVLAAVVVLAGVTVPIVDALASGPPDVTTAGLLQPPDRLGPVGVGPDAHGRPVRRRSARSSPPS